MFKAVIFSKVHNREFYSKFFTKDKAEEFIINHPLLAQLKSDDYSVEVFEILPNGERKPDITIPPVIPIKEDPLIKVRKDRNYILQATDWLFLSDVIIEQKHRRIYMEYRKYLRNIPNNPKNGVTIEKFDNWLRRNYPEEFMDGGSNRIIIDRFNSYIED